MNVIMEYWNGVPFNYSIQECGLPQGGRIFEIGERKMRKTILSIVPVLLTVFFLASCGKSSKDADAKGDSTAVASGPNGSVRNKGVRKIPTSPTERGQLDL